MNQAGRFSPRHSRRPGQASSLASWRGASLLFFLVAAQLTLDIVIGGASRENTFQVALLELISLPLSFFALTRTPGAYRERSVGDKRQIKAAIFLIVAAIVLALAQLIPLPPGLWAKLSGRLDLARSFDLAAIPRPWLAWSLEPDVTRRTALALAPPIAIFLGVLKLGNRERGMATGLILLLTALGLLIGALQLVSGDASPLYFYPTTNTGSPVGFFANRNHEALLLVISLPLAAAWVANLRDGRLRLGLSVAFTVMVIVGIGVERSRAGVLLLGPALVGAALVLASARRDEERVSLPLLIGAGASLIAVLLVVKFGLDPLLDRFYEPEAQDLRILAASPITSAAAHYAPFGTGLGTFEEVYKSVEPLRLVGRDFLNHAHDDYLELWLETGIFGVALIAGFILWWGASAVGAWRHEDRGATFGRAGAIMVVLVLAHSALDYPLRTIAISSVFAFGCGLMVRPRARKGAEDIPAPTTGVVRLE